MSDRNVTIVKRDIEVEWELNATCSVCPEDEGQVVVVDAETIACETCGSWWDMDGAYQGTEDLS